LEAIFRESPAAMALWCGPDRVFAMVNPAYQAIFGDRPLLGRPLHDALPELRDQPFAALIDGVMTTGETYHGTEVLARLAREDGGPVDDHYYDFSYIRIELEPDGEYGVYCHAVDVTERVTARRQLEAVVGELHHERELRERLVAALSHDLRTPLNNARLGAELMMMRSAAGSNDHRSAGRIIANVDRAEQMLRDLLDASRLRAGETLRPAVSDGDAVEVVRATLDEMAGAHGPRFTLRAPPHQHGRWDLGAFQRIVENLAGNAVKYGEPGAQITIVLDAVDRDGRDMIRLRVHNHGQPIPAAEQATLFDLFRRGMPRSRAIHGWGIGLSLVRGLAAAQGGEVSVHSAAGEGTTFCVLLPRAVDA
jgi:signal transduction histidine kinase